jgi:ribosomal protein L23
MTCLHSENLVSSCQTLNVDHAQLRKIINTGTKTRHRKSNLRNKGQYHLSSENSCWSSVSRYWDTIQRTSCLSMKQKLICWNRNGSQMLTHSLPFPPGTLNYIKYKFTLLITVSSCQTLNVDHAQLRKIINTGTKTRHRKSNLRNKGQ